MSAGSRFADQPVEYRRQISPDALGVVVPAAHGTGADFSPALDGPLEELGRLVADALSPARADMRRTLTAMVRASGHDQVRARLREAAGNLFAGRLTKLLDGPDADLRAQLIALQLLGIILGWTIIATDEIAGPDLSRTIQLYGRAIQQLIDAPGD